MEILASSVGTRVQNDAHAKKKDETRFAFTKSACLRIRLRMCSTCAIKFCQSVI